MADTKTPRSRVQLCSAFPLHSSGRSTLFPVKEESTVLAPSSPFSSRSAGRTPSPVDILLTPTRAPLLKASTGSGCPLSSSRTIPHVRSAPSATVKQEKSDTARRASNDSTASGQINRAVIPLNAKKSHLSSSRTGSEPSAPLGLRQTPSSAARAPSGLFLIISDGAARPGSVGPQSSRAPGAQCSQNSTLPAPQMITDDSCRSLTLLLSIQRSRWCCFGSHPPVFRSGPHRRLSLTTCRLPARSSL